jgi:uncharacterized OB-fold protein
MNSAASEELETRQRSIDENLFVWPAASPALKASRCPKCGAIAFPASASCMACGNTDVVVETLPRRGTLWTWTIQRFMPKPPYHSSESPETFTPFGLGYVELPGALRIETRLLENNPDRLKIGSEMELAFYVHRTEPDGIEIINYAFKPV